ncbi:MAG: cytochrome c oxidase subunit 3, partial [Gemmatimonadota bacterium]
MTASNAVTPGAPARTGVWIGIATITMSFAAYTSAMVVRQGSGSDWQSITLPPILYLNTLLLLASSGTFAVGRKRLTSGWAESGKGGGAGWLQLTLLLGVLFLGGQVLAWRALAGQGLYLATTPNSGFFYVLTALHALHLLGGIGALLYLLVRIRRASAMAPL